MSEKTNTPQTPETQESQAPDVAAELTAAKSYIAELELNYEAAGKEIAALENKNAVLESENEALTQKLDEVEKTNPAKFEIFTFKNKKYKVSGAVNIPGKGKVTALDVASDPQLQQLLIEKKSGMVVEIKK